MIQKSHGACCLGWCWSWTSRKMLLLDVHSLVIPLQIGHCRGIGYISVTSGISPLAVGRGSSVGGILFERLVPTTDASSPAIDGTKLLLNTLQHQMCTLFFSGPKGYRSALQVLYTIRYFHTNSRSLWLWIVHSMRRCAAVCISSN